MWIVAGRTRYFEHVAWHDSTVVAVEAFQIGAEGNAQVANEPGNDACALMVMVGYVYSNLGR